jgi:hypothetical protein
LQRNPFEIITFGYLKYSLKLKNTIINPQHTNYCSMNKFYAIIGTALVAAGACATANAKVSYQKPANLNLAPVEITPEGQARLNAAQAFLRYERENGIEDPNTIAKRTWTDSSNKTWELTLVNSGSLADMFSFGSNEDFYSCWNIVLADFVCYTDSNNSVEYNIALTYPLQSLWQYMYDYQSITQTPQELFGDEYSANGLTPLSAWGTIFPADEFYFSCPEASASGVYLGYFDDSWAMTIINSTCGSASSGYYYQYGSLGYCSVVKNGNETLGGPTVGTYLKFSNFDIDTMSIDAELDGGATTTLNGSPFVSYSIPFSGEFSSRGMVSGIVNEYEIGEVHIINTGVNNYDNNEYYDVDWNEDLNRYYVMGCHPTLTVKESAITSDSVTSGISAFAALSADYSLEAFWGALYSPVDADPINVWKGMNIGYEVVPFGTSYQYLTTNAPEANSFVYGGYSASYFPFSEADGLRLVKTDHYEYMPIDADLAEDAKPIIMNGTTDGFGVAGYNQYSEYTKIHFTGDIIYHYDSTDYTKTRTLATAGDLATPTMWNGGDGVHTTLANGVKANVTTDNGRVNVTADADTVVYIYNVAGQAVKNVTVKAGQTKSIALGNGLYIVKAGDKAVKVAL